MSHLGFLEDFARDVERQVLRVDDALEEREPAWEQLLLEVVRDEDALDVELDRLHLVVEHVLRELPRDRRREEEERAELDLRRRKKTGLLPRCLFWSYGHC